MLGARSFYFTALRSKRDKSLSTCPTSNLTVRPIFNALIVLLRIQFSMVRLLTRSMSANSPLVAITPRPWPSVFANGICFIYRCRESANIVMSPSAFLTYRRLAQALRVTVRTVKRHMRDERFRQAVGAEKHGKRWRIPEPDFQAGLDALRERAAAFRKRKSSSRCKESFARAAFPGWGNRKREAELDALPLQPPFCLVGVHAATASRRT